MVRPEDIPKEELLQTMADWGMVPDPPEAMRPEAKPTAAQWYAHLYNDAHFTKTFVIPLVFGGRQCIIVASSTAASARAYRSGMAENQAGRMLVDPEWLHFDVFQYEGLAMMNFRGLTGPHVKLPGTLGNFLDGIFHSRGQPRWRDKYCMATHGMYLDGLRQLLIDLGIGLWLEITAAHSWLALYGLDIYIRMHGVSMPYGAEEAHFLLNCTTPWPNRRWFTPEQWHFCHDWVSIGQKPGIADCELLDIRGQLRITVADRRARARALLREIQYQMTQAPGYRRSPL